MVIVQNDSLSLQLLITALNCKQRYMKHRLITNISQQPSQSTLKDDIIYTTDQRYPGRVFLGSVQDFQKHGMLLFRGHPQQPLKMFHQSSQVTSDAPSQQILGRTSSNLIPEKTANTTQAVESEVEEIEEPVQKKKDMNSFIIFRTEMSPAIKEEYADIRVRDISKYLNLITPTV